MTSAPAHALRTQAGLESDDTRATLTTTLTGLEESQPVVETVQPGSQLAPFLESLKASGAVSPVIVVHGGASNLFGHGGFMYHAFRQLETAGVTPRFVFVGRRRLNPKPAQYVTPQAYADAVRAAAELRARLTKGLPYLGYLDEQEFAVATAAQNGTIMVAGRPLAVDGVILSVPTNQHLPLTEFWLNQAMPTPPIIFVEKPYVMPDELEAMDARVRKYPDRIFAVDFFPDSDAFIRLLDELQRDDGALLMALGPLRACYGRCVEPWAPWIEPRTWLWNIRQSGGGHYVDMALHPLAMLEQVFQVIGRHEGRRALSLRQAVIQQVRLGRATERNGASPLPTDLENYGLAQFVIPAADGHGAIQGAVDAGKGVDTVFYGIDLMFAHGRIQVMIGTDKYDPKLTIAMDGRPVREIKFPQGGLGYTRTLVDFLFAMRGQLDRHSGADLATRHAASANSLWFVREAYHWAEAHHVPITPYVVGTPPPIPPGAKVPGEIPAAAPPDKKATRFPEPTPPDPAAERAHDEAAMNEWYQVKIPIALAALDGLRWQSDVVHPLTTFAVVFAGDAVPAAVLMDHLQRFDDEPSFIPFAATSDPKVIARLVAAGFPRHRILAYDAAALLRPSEVPHPAVNYRPILRVFTTREDALAYLHRFGQSLEFPDSPDPERLTTAITRALDLLARYL